MNLPINVPPGVGRFSDLLMNRGYIIFFGGGGGKLTTLTALFGASLSSHCLARKCHHSDWTVSDMVLTHGVLVPTPLPTAHVIASSGPVFDLGSHIYSDLCNINGGLFKCLVLPQH